MKAPAAALVCLASLGLGERARGQGPSQAPESPSYCVGTYADDFTVLSSAARRAEQSARYSFCVRTTATYQCLSYDPDGNIRKRKHTATAFGTAFAFRQEGTATYLLTNEHVTEWPDVTTADRGVEDVPAGCKKISEAVALVDNEKDEYERDDQPVERVLADAELDVAILRAPARLGVLPFPVGRSSALQAGNVVQVRGFPLGAFQAVNVGKVTNALEPDREKRWNHHDFVVDALLSSGNSGSPVLAVSCKTGAYELVGVYHAGYRKGAALNVVVGIDELRELMSTLQPRKRPTDGRSLTAEDRRQLEAWLSAPGSTPLAPFGGHVLGLRRGADGALLYDVFDRGFPLFDRRVLVIEDLAGGGFGRLGRIWFGSKHGLLEWSLAELEDPDRALVQRALGAARRQLLAAGTVRRLAVEAASSREAHERLRTLERQLAREGPHRRELIRSLVDAGSRYGPDADDEVASVQATQSVPHPPAGSGGKPEPARSPKDPVPGRGSGS